MRSILHIKKFWRRVMAMLGGHSDVQERVIGQAPDTTVTLDARFSRDAFMSLNETEQDARSEELETILDAALRGLVGERCSTEAFHVANEVVVDALNKIGHNLDNDVWCPTFELWASKDSPPLIIDFHLPVSTKVFWNDSW